MERHSNHTVGETASEELRKPNIEKVTEWLVGMQAEERRPKAEYNAFAAEVKRSKTERELERRQEVRDESQAIKRSGMVAVGEVLTNRSIPSQPPVPGTPSVRRTSRQKKMAREEQQATHISTVSPSSGLTTSQAVQLGVTVGVCAGLLILLWLSVR